MQQDQTPQEQQPRADAPPQWFQQYTQQLGGVLQQQNQQIARLAQTVAQGSQPAPVKPTIPAPPQSEIRERILGTIVNEPERFVSEVVGFAEQRAEAKMAEREMRLRQEMEYQRFNERFWGEFFSANPELQMFQGEVGAAFQQTDPNADYSARANYARDVVRQKIQAAQEAAKYAAEAQNQSRRAMAGAPGRGPGAPMQGDVDPDMDEAERTAEALAERARWRQSVRGENLRNDPEYYEERNKMMKARRRANAA